MGRASGASSLCMLEMGMPYGYAHTVSDRTGNYSFSAYESMAAGARDRDRTRHGSTRLV